MMLDRISEALVRWRWWFVTATMLSVVLALIGMQGITLDTTNEAFFEKGDEISIGNDRFKSIFGNDDSAIILVAAQGGGTVFRTDILANLDQLSDDIRLSGELDRADRYGTVWGVDRSFDEDWSVCAQMFGMVAPEVSNKVNRMTGGGTWSVKKEWSVEKVTATLSG
jgi:hypothetical protein